MITIDNLRHFIAVVDNQGVLRAADKVFISASSITRSLQQIETELGSPVFDRVGRGLTLNEEGRRFYEKANRLLQDYERLLHREERGGELAGHYRMGASHFLCEHLLCGLVSGLAHRFPKATFEVYSFDSNVLLKKLHDGEMDIGFSFSPKASEAIESRTLHRGQLRLCAGKGHPLIGKPFTEVKNQLADYPAIIHHPVDSIERCDNHPMFRRFRITPKIQVYWDSDYFAMGMLVRHRYWSMLPELVIASNPKLAAFRHPSHWSAPYQVALLWNRRRAVEDLRDAAIKLLEPL